MSRYYTRVCNFYYGKKSQILVKNKKSLPLNGNKEISFDHIELISRKSIRKVPINKIFRLSKELKKKVAKDIKKITTKKKKFCKFKF